MGVDNLCEEQVEKGQKREKCPLSLSLKGIKTLPFDDRFAPLIAKISRIVEKTVFVDQFKSVPFTSSRSLPTTIGQFRYVIAPSISMGLSWISPNFIL